MASGFKALGIAVALLALVAVAVWDGGRSSELEQQVRGGCRSPGTTCNRETGWCVVRGLEGRRGLGERAFSLLLS
jgi:hypothetical protein